MEEKKLVACAFKSRLNEIKEGIKKVDLLIKKSKFEHMRQYLDNYKKGLLQDLLEEALKMRWVV